MEKQRRHAHDGPFNHFMVTETNRLDGIFHHITSDLQVCNHSLHYRIDCKMFSLSTPIFSSSSLSISPFSLPFFLPLLLLSFSLFSLSLLLLFLPVLSLSVSLLSLSSLSLLFLSPFLSLSSFSFFFPLHSLSFSLFTPILSLSLRLFLFPSSLSFFCPLHSLSFSLFLSLHLSLASGCRHCCNHLRLVTWSSLPPTLLAQQSAC